MGFYLYCIGSDLRTPPQDMAGVTDDGIRRMELAGFDTWVSASDRRPEITLDTVRRHNSVVEAAVERATALLPVRFGQWNVSADGLETALAERRGDYEAALARVAGAVEAVVTVIDPAAARRAGVAGAPGEAAANGVEVPAAAESDAGAHASGDTKAPGPGSANAGARTGRAYMEALAKDHARTREREERADRILEDIRGAVNEHMREERIRKPRGAGTILSIAHLVPGDEVDAYRRSLYPYSCKFPGLRVLLSGPWPPYSFVE